VTTPLYQLKDREIGNLDKMLQRCVRDGVSVRQLARDLSAQGVPVSKSTAQRWLSQASTKLETPNKRRSR
jgi:transposase-like protein